MRARIVKWAEGFGYARLAAIAIITVFLIWLTYTVAHRIFFAPGEQKKAEATLVVAKEQGKAEEVITTETLDTMRESQEVRADVQEKVARGKVRIHVESRRPPTAARPSNDAAVHNAGVAALCELHDSFCGDAGPAPVQPVHRAVP